MRRLMMVVLAAVAFTLIAAAPTSAQEIGPTPYWTFPPVGPTPYVECPPYYGGPPPYYVGPTPYHVGPTPYAFCEAGAPLPGAGSLPQTGTSLALIAGAGVVVMLLGLWAARRHASS